MLVKNGVDVPFYTASGYDIFKLYFGDCEETWAGVDFRIESEYAIAKLREYQPDKPPLISEYWSGRAMHWGANFTHRDPEPIAEAYKKALELGAYVNFYMFCGGTNFGFMNGANYGRPYSDKKENPERYMPGLTSYDVDALVSENGVPTPKYYIIRKVLDKFLGKPEREDKVPPYQTQEIKDVVLTKTAPLFDNLSNIAEKIVQSANVKTMEDLDQDYGFILYSTTIDYTDDRVRYLRINGLHDRATVYANGKYIGTYLRDRDYEPIKFTIPRTGVKLDILVENLGRINYGYYLPDRKGITEFVRVDIEEPNNKGFLYNKAILMNWTIYTLPMKDLCKLEYGITIPEGLPGFYKGEFNASADIDTFLHMKGWTKGCVWINGFNLGRYWEIGPQETLYVPGELLKEGKNEIVIFEIHQPSPELKVNFIKEHILDGKVKEEL